jgi:hypothetical protein
MTSGAALVKYAGALLNSSFSTIFGIRIYSVGDEQNTY